MSKNSYLLVAAGAAALTLVSSNAATLPLNASPGLWQVTTQSSMSGQMPMDESELKTLPPAQRAKFQAAMQAAMAKAAAPHVFKECLTREKLARGFDVDKPDASCHRTIVTSSPTALEVRENCSSEGETRNGNFKFAMVNGTSMSGNITMQVRKAGKTMTINGTMQGHWLGSDCQGIKDVQIVKVPPAHVNH
jgi:hypothetical protein